MKIVVGISGASGSIYGIRLLEKLSAEPNVETHLILTRSAERTAYLETGKAGAEIKALAHHHYPVEDIGCRLASGSFLTAGMVVAPCSITSMSSIAHGISSNLLVRAADVMLKERRKLILMIRETPLHLGHLRSMTQLAEMGAIIAPPVPGFYHKPQTVEEIVDFSVDRVLDLLGLPASGGATLGRRFAMKRVTAAFQGELGAFSQIAVRQLLGENARPVACERFEQVFRTLADKKTDCAVVPIENTLHGSVHENYDHLLHFDFEITGETSVRIVHNLIAPPDVKLASIKRVYSHPVALNQCLKFFAANAQMERVSHYDTAGSVKTIMAERPEGAAAIASAVAAEMYGAKILKRSIEDDRQNFTRFFLLQRKGARPLIPEVRNKTSLVFTTKNTPGALFRALSAFALRDLNMAKIESRPLRGSPWEYLFYLDVLASANEPRMQKALGHLGELADMLRVLGCYPRGKQG